jgi:hypothetical protein
MSDQSKPLDRRALLRAIASTHLPLPIDIDIFEVAMGFHHDHAGLRLDDNRPGDVDAWAEAFGADKPTYGAPVPRSGDTGEFRSYRASVVLAGWPTDVCSYVDVDEAVES